MINSLVSVIIPVYNVERYLEKCLNSVIEQSYSNLEIIIVNDGSLDNSEEIIMRYQQKDNRIKYIKKENGGLSSARNAGIEACTGKYISFIDSDDWVDKDFIKELVSAAEMGKSQVAICNMTYIYENGKIKKRTPQICKDAVVTNEVALNDLLRGTSFKFHAVNKLYSASLFKDNHIEYPEGKIYEDLFTTYKLILAASNISYVGKNLYYYLQSRPGSILQKRFDATRLVVLDALEEIRVFLDVNNVSIKNNYEKLVVTNIISLANYLYPIYPNLSDKEKTAYMEPIRNAVQRLGVSDYIKQKNISVAEKIRLFLILNHMDLYVQIMTVLKRK